MKLSKKTGDLASVLMVSEEDELMLITDDGTIIRTPITDVRIMGRTTQGVRLMRVADDAVIVDVDIVAEEDDDDNTNEDEHLPAPFDDIEEDVNLEDNEEDF
jgi:DNA gyrase subunit A